jgi:WhiB family redox-sensing transcriptional regulator
MSRPTRNYEGVKACLDADPELFFPADKPDQLAPKERETYDQQVKEAKDHCAVCPLIDACWRAAFELRIEYGIWGGTTPAERRRYRQDLRNAQQGVTTLFDAATFEAEMAVAA